MNFDILLLIIGVFLFGFVLGSRKPNKTNGCQQPNKDRTTTPPKGKQRINQK